MNSSIPNNATRAAVSIHSNPISLVAWTSAAVLLALAAPALSVVVFLRHKFGCRYIKLWMVSVVAGFLWSVFSLYAKSWTSVTPARFFAVAMMALAVYHSRNAWSRFWKAVGKPGKTPQPQLLWHSMNDGESWIRTFIPHINERLLKVVLEPAIVGGVGLVLFITGFTSTASTAAGSRVGPGLVLLSYWLFAAAATLSLYESMLYEQRLNGFIDMVDGQIDSMAMLGINTNADDTRVKTSPEDSLGSPVAIVGLENIVKAADKLGQDVRTKATAREQATAAGA